MRGRKMCRFIASIAVVFISIIALTTMMEVESLSIYVDFSSLFVVVVLPLVFQMVLFGFSNTYIAFKAPFEKSTEDELKMAANFFETYGKVTWLFVIMAMGLGLVAALTNFYELQKMGSYIAITILTFLYGAAWNLLLICPYTACIKKKL